MRLIVAVLALSAAAGCLHTTAAGCTEYKPLCMGVGHVCSTDARGCEVCTCESPSLNQPDPRNDHNGQYPYDVNMPR